MKKGNAENVGKNGEERKKTRGFPYFVLKSIIKVCFFWKIYPPKVNYPRLSFMRKI